MPGLALAWATYTPTYSSWKLQGSIRDDPRFLWAAAGVWAVSGIYIISFRLISHANPCTELFFQLAELFNLHAHITLRNLRPPGTKTRAIPRGFGFNLVSCPNYLWEIVSWAVIAGMTNNIYGGFLSHQ